MGQAFQHIDNAYADTSKGKVKTALGRLNDFVIEYELETPFECTLGDPAAGVHNELTLLSWAASMQEDGLAPGTIASYVSLAKTALSVRLGWLIAPKEALTRLPRFLKGIRRLRPKGQRKKRLGWRAAYMRRLVEQFGLPATPEAHSRAAVMNAARQCLLRGADFLPRRPNLYLPDVYPRVGDWTPRVDPRNGRRYAQCYVTPAKKGPDQGKTELLIFGEGDGITDAYTAIEAMLAARAAKAPLDPDAPLFAHADGSPWTSGQLRALFKEMAAAIGLPVDELGSHAGRIGGATDLFAANCPPAVLQVMGRWDSDIWAIYTRICLGQVLDFAEAASTIEDQDLEALNPAFTQAANRPRT